MNKSMLASFVILLTVAFVIVFAERTGVDRLNDETSGHLIETRQKRLSNGGKFETEITRFVETGWGGKDNYEMGYFYQPPGDGRREFVGRSISRSRGRGYAHLQEDRLLISESDAIFLRSPEGIWQEFRWASYRFPGRESQAA